MPDSWANTLVPTIAFHIGTALEDAFATYSAISLNFEVSIPSSIFSRYLSAIMISSSAALPVPSPRPPILTTRPAAPPLIAAMPFAVAIPKSLWLYISSGKPTALLMVLIFINVLNGSNLDTVSHILNLSAPFLFAREISFRRNSSSVLVASSALIINFKSFLLAALIASRSLLTTHVRFCPYISFICISEVDIFITTFFIPVAAAASMAFTSALQYA